MPPPSPWSHAGAATKPARPGGKGQPPDPNDKRAVALDCIVNKEGLQARLVGEQSIQVGAWWTSVRGSSS